jgi:DNA-binding CsgD family transcriptional regulator
MTYAATQALDQLAAGVIITDSDGRLVGMNRTGKAIVQIEDGLLIRNDRLCARRTFETTRVIKLISGIAASGESTVAVGRMLIGRCNGIPPYVMSVTPLRTGLLADDRRLAMVIVIDPVRSAPSETDLAGLFGLSAAEARVAAALSTGRTLAEIATAFDIRITTVRTQLASILKKVGVKRQSDLMRILSSTGIGSLSFITAWLDFGLEALQIPLSFAGV